MIGVSGAASAQCKGTSVATITILSTSHVVQHSPAWPAPVLPLAFAAVLLLQRADARSPVPRLPTGQHHTGAARASLIGVGAAAGVHGARLVPSLMARPPSGGTVTSWSTSPLLRHWSAWPAPALLSACAVARCGGHQLVDITLGVALASSACADAAVGVYGRPNAAVARGAVASAVNGRRLVHITLGASLASLAATSAAIGVCGRFGTAVARCRTTSITMIASCSTSHLVQRWPPWPLPVPRPVYAVVLVLQWLH